MRVRMALLAGLAASACAAQQPGPAPLAGPDGQIRLRCGSEALRARIRAEGVEVEKGDGSKSFVPPARDGQAAVYANDEFTFFKVRGTGGWQVEAKDGRRQSCSHEPAAAAP